jgi:hypothetical protein
MLYAWRPPPWQQGVLSSVSELFLKIEPQLPNVPKIWQKIANIRANKPILS